MVRLSNQQIDKKLGYIDDYIYSLNAADGSKMDANANVSSKNLATLSAELHKDSNIQINRRKVYLKILELFGEDLANDYIHQLEKGEIYCHDETSILPYCVSISMYPFLTGGLTALGGESKAPQHLNSYCGGFVNLVFSIASQFAGAVATVEFLMCFDYFARKDFGDNYLVTHRETIENALQHVVYALNQPAAARGYQCVRADTTQLSTPDGYKYLHELKEGDECYVWKNNKISIEKINKLNVYDFNDELIQFKGRNYQQTVTSNHRVLYKVPNTNDYKIKEAKDLVNHSKLSLPIAAEFEDREDFQISDDLLILCAAVLCDGCFENENKNSRIELYTSPNRWGGKNIPDILDRNGIGYSIKTVNNAFGPVNHIRISSVDAQIILRFLKHNKKELPHWLTLLSSRQARLFIETWSKFDGSNSLKTERKVTKATERNHENTYSLQCDNEDIADVLQQIVFIAGYGSKKESITHNKIDNINEKSNKTSWYIRTFARVDKRVNEFNKIQYNGKVWCPSTEAGVVIFREENGIPYISGNSVFWNISVYDKEYFNAMFENFCFPDKEYTKPKYENISKLQEFFLTWFNKERSKSVLTFPVVTAACLQKDGIPVDKHFENIISKELSEGNSFFIFMSDNPSSLSSCCRLKNSIEDQINDFSYSLGAGGTMTGSKNVITININRLVQDNRDLSEQVTKIHKYQTAHNAIFEDYLKAGMMPVFDAGFITLDKQFLTIGINGVVEAAEYLGYEISNNDKYKNWLSNFLKTISDLNTEYKKKTGLKINCEVVPGENLGHKFAKRDKKDGYVVPRDIYNSYFYIVEKEESADIDSVSILDKFALHGKDTSRFLDGGSAYHCNLESYLTPDGFKQLIRHAAKVGCEYFCFNIKITICNECENIDKRTLIQCPECGSKNIDYGTRIIGYLKRVSSFSTPRQKEENLRFYHKKQIKSYLS